MAQALVMANWKSYGSLAFAKNLCESILQADINKDTEVVLFVPYPYLSFVSSLVKSKNIKLGAQNVSAYLEGAYTGEVHSQMLADIGCDYVLVGHSERRALFSETDEIIEKKIHLALEAQLSVVLCVGETYKQRENNQAYQVVERQLLNAIKNIKDKNLKRFSIAYEPVWAIGTGLAATTEDVNKMHQFIRKVLKNHKAALAKQIRIVYGGSVKPQNAHDLFRLDDVDGGLIGGASLDADSFVKIVNMA